ncbi:MAG: protoheme IX farnesyltransferase [Novosphingobium sp. 63-713]|uniref:heme o synthase n=1 Tax=unclassified Novosphingobium TaxID=2644732 RepID=UPI00086C6F93|nr:MULTISPECIES: heme o synthase [unclassified Novosphingobium]MBN9145093.1 heme o synthase [Novosphingobium sp.]MDR6709015.1 protoheme IX farnesyltransferase [Novosphingobium sp. 1748]ODU70954.1 MAG: protoheme IX farnesyltransferase [Novosphingobium sp. SCN 66-18]OJX89904.1 MAG: protoheme IX farnesyltransferase [Novosphingobium sp. 63-713]
MSIPPVKTGAKPAARQPADWRDFFALTKPRVMTLVIFTGLCGLLAAPGHIHPVIGFATILCIAVGAGGAAALNQWWEADIDAGMKRTAKRPLPAGRMDRESARDFGMALSGLSVLTMGLAAGWICAVILAVSIVYYALVYTVWLKPRTPQNIVIGGGAGAFPPMIGWVAVTGHITWMPVLLFLIIFMWTPPHFWALALFVKTDYAKVGIPMMPVVAGEKSTRRQIFAYSVLLLPLTLLPVFLPKDDGGPGWIYGVSAGVLSTLFLLLAIRVGFRNRRDEDDSMKPEKQLFAFSVLYLFALFAALVADRWVPIIGGYL